MSWLCGDIYTFMLQSGKGEGDDQKENALPEKDEEELKDEPKTTAEQQQGSVNMEVQNLTFLVTFLDSSRSSQTQSHKNWWWAYYTHQTVDSSFVN